MKKLVLLLLLLFAALGYYLYRGPVAPFFQAAEFPLKVMKEYEDKLLIFKGSKGEPKEPGEGAPARRGKVVVLESIMHMQPRLQSSFFGLDEQIRAANPEEVETVIVVHFVPALGGGIGAPHQLYWGSFDWPSGKCLGFERVKTWPANYGMRDVKADYPDFTEKIKAMKTLKSKKKTEAS